MYAVSVALQAEYFTQRPGRGIHMPADTSMVSGGQSERQRREIAFHLADLRRAHDHGGDVRLIEPEP